MVLIGDVKEPRFFLASEATSARTMLQNRTAVIHPAGILRENALRSFVIDAAWLFPSKRPD